SPYYLKNKRFNLIFQKTSFTIEMFEGKPYVKLSLGKTMKKRANKIDPDSKGFLWFKISNNLEELNVTIDEIEISPSNDQTIAYINYKYEIKVPEQIERVDE